MKRFYCRVEIRTTNPYLVAATALYLACKIEECPQHIRLIVGEARALWGDFVGSDTSKLGECEFSLISEIKSQLIIYQPYRTLQGLTPELNLPAEDATLAWSVINDHYMTDLPLLYPPHIIAHTAILLALVLRPIAAGGGGPQGVVGAAGGGGPQAGSSSGGGGAQDQQQQQQHRQAQLAAAVAASATGAAAGNVAKLAAALSMAQGRPTGVGQAGPGGGGAATTPGGGIGVLASPTPSKGDMERISRVQRYTAWLAETNIDIEAMVDCAQELISFYECHEQYKDKDTRDQINRFVKARGLDK
jgi:cyclin C